MEDGVNTDATWRNGEGAIGVVLVEAGHIQHRHATAIQAVSSHDAEVQAMRWGIELYPDRPRFCDAQSVALIFGATWIKRDRNREAHAAAKKAIANERKQRIKKYKRWKKRRIGGGVMPADVKRLAFA